MEMIDDGTTEKSNQIEWGRAFIRSGFVFRQVGNGFDFSDETRENVWHLQQILSYMKYNFPLWEGRLFSPPSFTVDEPAWLQAIGQMDKGIDIENFTDAFKLKIIDVYMAGIVRWLNAIGIRTVGCCDGDQRPGRAPYLQLANKSDEIHLDYFIRVTTKHEWGYGNRRFRRRNPKRENIAEDEAFDASWLLDVAEQLYHCREPFQELIQLFRESADS